MSVDKLKQLAAKYAEDYNISQQQSEMLVTTTLHHDPSGKVLIFALALLTQDVGIDVILKALAFDQIAVFGATGSTSGPLRKKT